MKADWLSIGRFSLRLSFIFGRYVLDQSSSKKKLILAAAAHAPIGILCLLDAALLIRTSERERARAKELVG